MNTPRIAHLAIKRIRLATLLLSVFSLAQAAIAGDQARTPLWQGKGVVRVLEQPDTAAPIYLLQQGNFYKLEPDDWVLYRLNSNFELPADFLYRLQKGRYELELFEGLYVEVTVYGYDNGKLPLATDYRIDVLNSSRCTIPKHIRVAVPINQAHEFENGAKGNDFEDAFDIAIRKLNEILSKNGLQPLEVIDHQPKTVEYVPMLIPFAINDPSEPFYSFNGQYLSGIGIDTRDVDQDHKQTALNSWAGEKPFDDIITWFFADVTTVDRHPYGIKTAKVTNKAGGYAYGYNGWFIASYTAKDGSFLSVDDIAKYILHELGHLFGFSHRYGKKNIMRGGKDFNPEQLLRISSTICGAPELRNENYGVHQFRASRSPTPVSGASSPPKPTCGDGNWDAGEYGERLVENGAVMCPDLQSHTRVEFSHESDDCRCASQMTP